MAENKKHWYDGWFYDLLIAPNQDRMFGEIKNILEPGSKVIDVGCGTGRFSFNAVEKCSLVHGIDLSKRNIDRANKTLKKRLNSKLSFHHKSVSEIILENKEYYDYAVITYVIHEVDESKRTPLINEISSIAEKIIIGDYIIPRPAGFWKIVNEIIEFVAGTNHYKNYKSYIKNNGIAGLAAESGMQIIHEVKNTPITTHIAVLSKKGI